MPRKIKDKLIQKLIKGSLNPLLTYLQKEKQRLKLEVRRNSKFIIYYKKCKVLEVGLNSFKIDKKYFDEGKAPINIESQIESDPKLYFDYVCTAVDTWLLKNPKNEFETQQNIAYHNQQNITYENQQQKNNRYIILDMEYQFSQEEIEKAERLKPATFDLLGIDTTTNDIVFFEVKRGIGSLEGKSGIAGHIKDFEDYFHGKHRNLFLKNLLTNIENITNDKKELGLLDYTLPNGFSIHDVKLVFVFEPNEKKELKKYEEIFNEVNTTSHKSDYHTLFVSKEKYILEWK